MPRPMRIDFEGALHHVMNRGAARRAIYRDDDDRQLFLECLATASRSTEMQVASYCLKSNHFHLLVRSKAGKLSDFIRMLVGRYSRLFNQRSNSDGPIFRGRCHSVEIETEAQFLETSRYIHLNPVKAGLTAHPADWQWSSARAVLGLQAGPEWLQASLILELFSLTYATTSYATFLDDGIETAFSRHLEELERL